MLTVQRTHSLQQRIHSHRQHIHSPQQRTHPQLRRSVTRALGSAPPCLRGPKPWPQHTCTTQAHPSRTVPPTSAARSTPENPAFPGRATRRPTPRCASSPSCDPPQGTRSSRSTQPPLYLRRATTQRPVCKNRRLCTPTELPLCSAPRHTPPLHKAPPLPRAPRLLFIQPTRRKRKRTLQRSLRRSAAAAQALCLRSWTHAAAA